MGTTSKGFVIRTLEKRLTKKDKEGKQETVSIVVERRGKRPNPKPKKIDKSGLTKATPKGKIKAQYIPYPGKPKKVVK